MFPSKSILAATDLTRQCEPALRTASSLARLTGADLHIFHAMELSENPYVHRAGSKTAFQTLVRDTEDGLAEQVRQTTGNSDRIKSVESIIFLPWKAIVQRAEDVDAELIVMGPHTHAFGDRFLGATADRVVRFATAPSLIVRRGDVFDPRRIVVGIDGSAASEGAMAEAIAWASGFSKLRSCELHIVFSTAGSVFTSAGASFVDAAVTTASAVASSGVGVQGELLLGRNVADDLKGYADRSGAELLVLATSGHGTIDRLVTGSVTSEVALNVSCPVLIVPARTPLAERLRHNERAAYSHEERQDFRLEPMAT